MTAQRSILLTVILGNMLAPLNSTMIAVAMPRIMSELGLDVASSAWLVTGYLVIMASLQPVGGKLGDRWGRRPFLLGGLAVFGLASLGATVAPNFELLVFFRMLQATSGAITLPNASALIREIYPAEERGSRFGTIGAFSSLAAAFGPPLGGLLVGIAGWRAIFWVNLLFIVPALLVGWRTVPETRDRKAAPPFDLEGAALLFVLLAGTAGILMQMHAGGVQLYTVLLGAALTAGWALFVWFEQRHRDPVLQPRFFKKPAFAAASGGVALSNMAMYCTMLTLPILVTQTNGRSAQAAGLLLAAMSITSAVCAPLGGWLADRWGRRRPTFLGYLLLAVGVLPLTLAAGQVADWLMVASLGLAGVGLGLASAGNTTSALESVPEKDTGVAAGVYSTSRYLGSIVGSSLLAALLSGAGSYQAVFYLVQTSAVLSVLVSLWLPDRSPVESEAA